MSRWSCPVSSIQSILESRYFKESLRAWNSSPTSVHTSSFCRDTKLNTLCMLFPSQRSSDSSSSNFKYINSPLSTGCTKGTWCADTCWLCGTSNQKRRGEALAAPRLAVWKPSHIQVNLSLTFQQPIHATMNDSVFCSNTRDSRSECANTQSAEPFPYKTCQRVYTVNLSTWT